jgi:hypothetical protein
MRKVGGVAVVLAMVEAADMPVMLHLALSLLKCVLQFNPRNMRDMQACHGYHLLAIFLHRRMTLFDIRDLDILFDIASCQASVSPKPVLLQEVAVLTMTVPKTASIKEPTVRQMSGVVPDLGPSPKFVSKDSGIDAELDAISFPSKFDDQGSSYGSVFDHAESFGHEGSMGAGISELGGVDTSVEDVDCIVLTNVEMVEHVLLDWTLWVTAPISVQLAILGFIERLLVRHRYHLHNMTVLRRIDLVKRLLIILQRGDVEILVVEKLVNLLALMLKDGFLPVELNTVADFVVMTFEPLGMMRGGNPNMAHEPMSTQVKVRNTLLEMLIDLQMTIKTDDAKMEEWHRLVSSKLITFLLEEAVHPTSMRWIMTLLGTCLSMSTVFASKFKSTGGHQALLHVLPSFFDSPEVYFVLFCLLFNQSVYPRQPEVQCLYPNIGIKGQFLLQNCCVLFVS